MVNDLELVDMVFSDLKNECITEREAQQQIKTLITDKALSDVLSKCRKGSIVAFKDNYDLKWHTGYISTIYEPKSIQNKGYSYHASISYAHQDGTESLCFYSEICDIVLLEY